MKGTSYSLYVAGEDIPAGTTVCISGYDSKLYRASRVMGITCGNAVENLREGFRCQVDQSGTVREDDA